MNGKTNSSIRPAGLLLAALTLLGGPALAQSADPADYGDDYVRGDYGRLMHRDGELTVQRAVGDPGSPLTETLEINGPVFPGDALRSEGDARGEVQLAGGTLVRLDRSTELTFLALPSSDASFVDNTVLQLARGTIRVDAVAPGEQEFRIDTPVASIYLLGEGDFRIEVDPAGTTLLASRRGVAELAGATGSVLVRGGMRARVTDGATPTTPAAYNTFETDGFDRWVALRDEAYRDQDRHAGDYDAEVYQELPAEVQPYYRELSAQGRWVYTADYGYVWYPASTAEGWRPYSDGYWAYGPSGYFWVGAEPWGWAPYHYGRWNWVVGTGWCWIPGRVFAGAWVAWSWGSLYLGWGPLDYWNGPAYYGPVYYGYYDYNCWTFVRYSNLHHHGYYHDKAYPKHAELSGNAVVTRPPRVSPDRMAQSRDAVDRAVSAARSDTRARMRPVDAPEGRATSMVDLEQRWSRVGSDRTARGRTVPSGAALQTPSGRPVERVPAGGRPTAAGSGSTAEPSRATLEGRAGGADRPRAARRFTPDRATTTDRGSATSPRGSAARPPATAPRRSVEPEGSSQRVRTMYREMARPRTTRPGESNGAAPGRTRVETPPRGSASRPSAAPSRSSSSPRSPAPGARSGSSSRSSGARAQPKSGGSSSGRQGARPKSSSGGSSRSSGASSSRGSGSNSSRQSGARPRSSSRGSSPSAGSRPRSSSGGSASRGQSSPSRSGSSRSSRGKKN